MQLHSSLPTPQGLDDRPSLAQRLHHALSSQQTTTERERQSGDLQRPQAHRSSVPTFLGISFNKHIATPHSLQNATTTAECQTKTQIDVAVVSCLQPSSMVVFPKEPVHYAS